MSVAFVTAEFAPVARSHAVPVVTATGGLVDTVVDADAERAGTGFVAGRIMAIDWSWRSPAADYLQLDEDLVDRPRP